MTSYQLGEIVLVNFPYAGGGGGKVRPALVIADTGDADVILARITTQPATSPSDVALSDWNAAGLLAPSVVRVHKLATIEKVSVVRVLGQLTSADQHQVGLALQQLFAGW